MENSKISQRTPFPPFHLPAPAGWQIIWLKARLISVAPGGGSRLELDLLIRRLDMDLSAPHSSCLTKRPLWSSGLHSDGERLMYPNWTWQILSSWVAVSDYEVVVFMRVSFHLSHRSAAMKPLTDAARPQPKLFVSHLTLSNRLCLWISKWECNRKHLSTVVT